jgi:hypothetical protein
MARIAILVHRHDAFQRLNYWLRAISGSWRDRGIELKIVYGPRARADADLAVLHVDMTTVPGAYLDHASRYPRVINGRVHDISKRLISAQLLQRGDPYDGPVIIKMNRNAGGGPERILAKRALLRSGSLTAFATEAYGVARHWQRHGSRRAFRNYPIFASAGEVPQSVWNDPELVVERFLPERRGEYYCVRTWLFFGDRDRHAIFFSRTPIVKSGNVVGFEPLSEVPQELQQFRENLKFEFGKFDYAMVDGRVILYDANRTPMIGAFPPERYLPIARSLAGGIKSFL